MSQTARFALKYQQKLACITDVLVLRSETVCMKTIEVLSRQLGIGRERSGFLQLASLVLAERNDDLVNVVEEVDAVGYAFAQTKSQPAHSFRRQATDRVLLVVVAEVHLLELRLDGLVYSVLTLFMRRRRMVSRMVSDS